MAHTTGSRNAKITRVVDSHLHVWANAEEAKTAFPYVQAPPEALRDRASVDSLWQLLKERNAKDGDYNNSNDSALVVVGALIVQPINHQFDHSYVRQAIAKYPKTFKGMMLHDPSLDAGTAVARLEELSLAGFVGVRFNPYLWKTIIGETPTAEASQQQQWAAMSEGAGLAVYQRCAELFMPVGIMCFQGLSRHYDDILQLLQRSPDTTLILDHFGFTALEEEGTLDEEENARRKQAFDQLVSLARYPAVHVKISAAFRLLGNDNTIEKEDASAPYDRVYRERFLPLLVAYGADRLLFGSDFPYVLEQPSGYSVHKLVSSWCPDEKTRTAILGGTAERLFGPWGSN